MEIDINSLRHGKEKFYGFIMMVVGCAVWVIALFLIVNSIVNGYIAQIAPIILYVILLWIVSYIAPALLRAYMFGHYVLIGPNQFPDLHRMVVEGAAAVRLDTPPMAFVYNSHGVMNAMALRLIGRSRYIWLTSALIDADNDEQVRFVIGHELGHHAAGHLDTLPSLLKLPGHFIPLLGAAYSRGRELTCDRIGLAVSGNLDASRTALQMLACGSAKLNATMNAQAFQAQEKMVPHLAGWLLHILSHYPRLTRRTEALAEWAERRADPTKAGKPRGQVLSRVEPTF
jgi:Zn-dependent protease with chaperone function